MLDIWKEILYNQDIKSCSGNPILHRQLNKRTESSNNLTKLQLVRSSSFVFNILFLVFYPFSFIFYSSPTILTHNAIQYLRDLTLPVFHKIENQYNQFKISNNLVECAWFWRFKVKENHSSPLHLTRQVTCC